EGVRGCSCIGEVGQGDDFELIGVQVVNGLEDLAADTAEAVDTNADGHLWAASLRWRGLQSNYIAGVMSRLLEGLTPGEAFSLRAALARWVPPPNPPRCARRVGRPPCPHPVLGRLRPTEGGTDSGCGAGR